MASRRNATAPSANGSSPAGSSEQRAPAPGAASETQPLRTSLDQDSVSEWITRALDEGVRPEQALAFIGLGLMRRLGTVGDDIPGDWHEGGETESPVDLTGLRQRLEITDLAIRTGAPLSTAEVAQLMGARPGASVVERGGLRARRLGRNVWKLSRSADGDRDERSAGFSEGFRRRL
ncbi:hypothetical protein [Synechococcus sp. CS-1332]|uniref:hypothetical protein n=1 Tax=Synechococcus sp. CS-1332 TaxID=2847972 RepID=UPI002880B483|nr:hypothetical protein [Synechococcus sp. CS-1332]MCT0207845.1 hypothetical protein [Synechococcus sp. CS-1332]